ncbi:MAG: hypothetical protein EHM41_26835, partial [Chloroflexi bacterium]
MPTMDEVAAWYRNSLGREADPGGLDFWQKYTGPDAFNTFTTVARNHGETYNGWTPATAAFVDPRIGHYNYGGGSDQNLAPSVNRFMLPGG